MHIFWYILIGLIGGWMATALVKGNIADLFRYALSGVMGSLGGGVIFPWFGYSANTNFLANTAAAVAGTVIVILSLRYIREWINHSKLQRPIISQKNEK